MKAFIFACLFSMISTMSVGQILKPVKWNFEVTQNEDATYTFTAKAKLDKNWVLYSQHTGEGGPIPLAFNYDEGVQLIGETKEESDAIKKMSKLFEIEVIKFENEAIFTQKFTPENGHSAIKGYLTFMCCDGKRCLAPTDIEFDVSL